MKKYLHHLALLLLSVILAVSGFPSAVTAGTSLKTGGSGFGLGLMNILAQAYARSHPDVRIDIVPSLGSSGGIKALLNGALDFSVSSRPLNTEEKNRGAVAVELVRTPYAFVVNRKVAAKAITTTELENIYSGRVTSWPDGTPIRLVLRPEKETDTAIIKGLSPAMAEAVKSAQTHTGMIVALTDQDSASSIEKISGALGGCTLTQILTEKRQVKALTLNGVIPSVKGIRDGSYPLAKTLYMVTTSGTSPAARKFIEFVSSAAGRKILTTYGNLVNESK